MPKFRPELNVEVDPPVEPKSEGELKVEAVVPPKIDDEELEPNALLLAMLGVPNNAVVEEVEEEPNVEPKGDGEELPNADVAKDVVFRAKGFEGVVEANGFVAG